MGNIIKINIYADIYAKNRREKNNKIKLNFLEENISRYNMWLKHTNREDKIENYEEFLRAQ